MSLWVWIRGYISYDSTCISVNIPVNDALTENFPWHGGQKSLGSHDKKSKVLRKFKVDFIFFAFWPSSVKF